MSRSHSAYWAWVLTRTLPLPEVISSAAQVTWGTALWSVLAPFLAMKVSPLRSCYSDRACTEGLHCGNVFQTPLVDQNEIGFKLNFRNEIGFPSDKPKTRLQCSSCHRNLGTKSALGTWTTWITKQPLLLLLLVLSPWQHHPPTDVATSDWGGRQHEINMKIMKQTTHQLQNSQRPTESES